MISQSLAELPLEQLLTRKSHHQRIERMARSLTRGLNLAWEDAAQSAHFKVLQAAQNRKFHYGGTEEFYHWATKVARTAIIDLVRQEYRRSHISLNHPLIGTDLTLMDIVPDPCQTWEIMEHADLVLKVREAIAELDQRYPQRHYRQLWNDRVQGLTQAQTAQQLHISQGAVSKRWQELALRIIEYLGLEQSSSNQMRKTAMARTAQLLTTDQHRHLRQRSSQSW